MLIRVEARFGQGVSQSDQRMGLLDVGRRMTQGPGACDVAVIATQSAHEDVEDDRLADRDGSVWRLAAVGGAGIAPNGEDAIAH